MLGMLVYVCFPHTDIALSYIGSFKEYTHTHTTTQPIAYTLLNVFLLLWPSGSFWLCWKGQFLWSAVSRRLITCMQTGTEKHLCRLCKWLYHLLLMDFIAETCSMQPTELFNFSIIKWLSWWKISLFWLRRIFPHSESCMIKGLMYVD